MNNLSEEPVHNLGPIYVKSKSTRRSTSAQVVATFIQSLLVLNTGMEMAFAALVVGALLNHPEEKLKMTTSQAAWFGSLPRITHFIACFLTGSMQDFLGRKRLMIVVNIPILTAWLTLYFADSVEALYIGNMLMGLCCGLTEAPLHSYTGEIGEPHIRGTLSTLTICSISVSYVVTYALAYLFDWRTVALIGAAESVITFVCMTQIPESPMWLISKNRRKDAQKSLSWLRGWLLPEEVHEEFLDLVTYTTNSNKKSKLEKPLEAARSNEKDEFVTRENSHFKTRFKELTARKMLLPFRMLLFIFAYTTIAGLHGVKPYMIVILEELKPSIDSKLILNIWAWNTLAGVIANIVFLRRFGKRKIGLFTQVVTSTCLLLVGAYCSFMLGASQTLGLTWIPVVLILSIPFCNGFSITPLPFQLLTEIFPPAGRGIACSFFAAWKQVLLFFVSISFLYIRKWIELSGAMYLYGVISVLGVLHMYFCLPETEGKSLAHIETYFTKDHDRKEKFSIGKPGGKSKSSYELTIVNKGLLASR